jgi:hypothetical protein
MHQRLPFLGTRIPPNPAAATIGAIKPALITKLDAFAVIASNPLLHTCIDCKVHPAIMGSHAGPAGRILLTNISPLTGRDCF